MLNVEAEKKPSIKKEIHMSSPVIPQYTTTELKEKTKIHTWRPKVALATCIGGLIPLLIWGINSSENYVYWYVVERERCIGIWFILLLLELYLIALFCWLDKGCFYDIISKKICVTEAIPITDIYGEKILLSDMEGMIKRRIRGIRLKVTDGIHKKKKFLLYENISEYWNCFPLCLRTPIPRHQHDLKYRPGEHKLEAVRIYYLKHSGIVVKLEVKHARQWKPK